MNEDMMADLNEMAERAKLGGPASIVISKALMARFVELVKSFYPDQICDDEAGGCGHIFSPAVMVEVATGVSGESTNLCASCDRSRFENAEPSDVPYDTQLARSLS